MFKNNSQNKKAPQMIHNMFRTAGAVALSLLVVGSPVAVPFSYAANAPTQNITLYPLDANTRSIVSYSDQACTQPTGKVYGTDKCKILEVLDQSIKLQYPTSKGTRTAYVKLYDFIKGNFYSADEKTMTRNQTIFAYENGSKKLGTVYQNDTIYVLYTGAGRAQIIYPISGGWKCGWVDLDAISNNSQNSSSLVSPVPEGVKFSKRTNDNGWTGYHDLNRNVSTSTPVRATTSGTAYFYQCSTNGKLTSYGNYIRLVSSDNRYETRYAHLSKFNGVSTPITATQKRSGATSKKLIATRQVSAGDILGYVGTTGNSSGVHLHLETYVNGKRVDPTTLFNGLT